METLMYLYKSLDTFNRDLLYTHGIHTKALKLLYSYLTNMWPRIKVDSSFSTCSELFQGVLYGSVHRPILFDIYLNGPFHFK